MYRMFYVLGAALLVCSPTIALAEDEKAPEQPAAAAKPTPSHWDNLKGHYDLDKDGKISWDEYQKVNSGFARLDKNGDGVLSADDKIEGPKPPSPEQLQKMMQQFNAGHAPHGHVTTAGQMAGNPFAAAHLMQILPVLQGARQTYGGFPGMQGGFPGMQHGMRGGFPGVGRTFPGFQQGYHGAFPGFQGRARYFPGHFTTFQGGFPGYQGQMPYMGGQNPFGNPHFMRGQVPYGNRPYGMTPFGYQQSQVFGPHATGGTTGPVVTQGGPGARRFMGGLTPPVGVRPTPGVPTPGTMGMSSTMPGHVTTFGGRSPLMAVGIAAQHADKDKDGTLTKAEWTAWVETLGADDKGVIKQEQLTNLLPPQARSMGAMMITPIFDRNSNGKIELSDLEAAWKAADKEGKGSIVLKNLMQQGSSMMVPFGR